MKKNNIAQKNTRPHVKWGALAIFIISIIVEIALIAIAFYANSGNMAGANPGVGILAAYGWICNFVFVLGGASYLSESFIPSFRKAKAYDKQQLRIAEIRKAVRLARKSNSKEYDRFRQEYTAK